MGRLLFLEPFDQTEPVAPDAPPSADWVAGHEAGLAEGAIAANLRQAELRDDVVQAIADLSFTYAEARTQVLASLTPLVAAIIDKLLPELARGALMPHVMDRIIAAARTDSAAPLRIAVEPVALPALQDSLPPGLPLPVTLEADTSLAPGQVLLRHCGQETALDLDLVAEDIRTILAALFDETQGRTRHG